MVGDIKDRYLASFCEPCPYIVLMYLYDFLCSKCFIVRERKFIQREVNRSVSSKHYTEHVCPLINKSDHDKKISCKIKQ